MKRIDKETRSRIMSSIRGKDTKIEVMLRKALWHKGYRYRKNYRNLPGTPDIVFTKERIAIFCDGEFWHGHNWDEGKCNIKSNREFWIRKIKRNIQRDQEVDETLTKLGWTVLRFWEKDIKNDTDKCTIVIEEIILRKRNADK